MVEYRPGGCETFFKLSSAETKIYPAHKILTFISRINSGFCDLNLNFNLFELFQYL